MICDKITKFINAFLQIDTYLALILQKTTISTQQLRNRLRKLIIQPQYISNYYMYILEKFLVPTFIYMV